MSTTAAVKQRRHRDRAGATTADAKQRRRRARARAGRIWLGIEVNEIDLVEVLIQIGLLHPWHAEDRAAITQATERLVEHVAGRHQTEED